MQEHRDELEKRGLDTKGLKADLVERLETSLAADVAPVEAEAEPPLEDAPKPASEHVPVSAPQEVVGTPPLMVLSIAAHVLPKTCSLDWLYLKPAFTDVSCRQRVQ